MSLGYITPETKLAIKIVAVAIFTMNLIGCMEIKRNNPFDAKNAVYSDQSLYGQIEGLRASYVGGAVNLSWNKLESDGAIVEYYQVSRSITSGSGDKPIGQPLDVTYADLDIVLDTTYYYKVKAVWPNGKESEESDEISVTLIGKPAITASERNTLALKSDGTLWAWGDNIYGQLGDGTTDSKSIPIQVGTDTNWTAIAAGEYHTLALKSDNSLWAWGRNFYGQLGDGTTDSKSIPIQVGTETNWTAIAAGDGHTIALKSDGSLWAWGYNSSGQLGDGTTSDKSGPIQIGTDNDWTTISAGTFHTLALKSDGSLWAWGFNFYGQLGDGCTLSVDCSDSSTPVQVGTDTDWTAITAGRSHTLALKSDSTLWAWGNNSYGQLGDGTTVDNSSPIQVGTDTNWIAIAAGSSHTLALKSDGSLWAWGSNFYGQLGASTSETCFGDPCSTTPVQVETDTNWTAIAIGGGHTIALKSDSSLWAWGRNSSGQLGDGAGGDKPSPIQVDIATNQTSITAGCCHTLSLKNDGSLWAWGANNNGQLGNGTNVNFNKSLPVRVGAETNWTAIAAGYGHTLALKSDGSLWAWGFNSSGQLGDGTRVDKTSPVQVGTATDWISVTAGTWHTIALKNGGSLWAWGSNSSGQLGDGTIGNLKTSPVKIGTDTDWTAIAAAIWHTIALKSDGTLWAWGLNNNGQLGISTSENCSNFPCSTVPVQVGTATDWTAITAGDNLSIALKRDGSLWAWGANSYGQLGDGTTDSKSIPIQVGTETNWTAIAAGSDHTLALKSDGSLWAWGNNSYGQLGEGTTVDKSSPVQIGTDTDWTAITAGSNHTIALKSDGSLWAWGRNDSSQLGASTSEYCGSLTLPCSTIPIQVSIETN